MASILQERGIAAKRFSLDNLAITLLPEESAKLIADKTNIDEAYAFFVDIIVDRFIKMTDINDLDPTLY